MLPSVKTVRLTGPVLALTDNRPEKVSETEVE